MKSKKEIKARLLQIQHNKAVAKNKGAEQAYIINCKLEKLFSWILED